jgi:GNAT superfamily N-acetyltransferase
MPDFTPVSVTDAGALSLLTQYFSDRETSFPSAQGTYRTTFPSPEQFLPPNGIFLLVSDEPAGADAARGVSTDGVSTDAVATDAVAAVFVGCGGIRRIDDSPTGAVRYEVKHLFLQPKARGRRWGRDLLAELERRAREFGAEELVLDTNASLEAAGALYHKAGYVDVEPYNDNPNATNWYAKRLT